MCMTKTLFVSRIGFASAGTFLALLFVFVSVPTTAHAVYAGVISTQKYTSSGSAESDSTQIQKTPVTIIPISSLGIIILTNKERADVGISRLLYNQTLVDSAQLKASDMAREGYFAHISPNGKTPWYWFKQRGYDFLYAGENLAVNFTNSQDINTAWMNSRGHKANILSKNFTEIGVATAQGMYQGKETTFVVQMFGSPAQNPKPITAPLL